MNYGVGHRHSSDPSLLRLWWTPAAVAPIRSLAWEPLYAKGAAKKKKDLSTLPTAGRTVAILFIIMKGTKLIKVFSFDKKCHITSTKQKHP